LRESKNGNSGLEYGFFVCCFVGCLELTRQRTKHRGGFFAVGVSRFSFCSPNREREKMTIKECPRHEGGFDCSPFCDICEGEQEYETEESNTKEGEK
jgi:hypothetical protein